MTKNTTWEERGVFGLCLYITVHHCPEGSFKQNKNLEAGADAEVMEERSLWACSPWLAKPALL